MGFWDICPEMHMNLEGLLKTDLPRILAVEFQSVSL